MSLISALNSAISGLRVNQAAIQVVSSNVAHATDPAYKRKSIAREAVHLGEDQVGGVAVSAYLTAANQSLRKQLEGMTARAGTSDAQSQYLSRVQDLFGTSADNATLTTILGEFTAAWQMMQANPESSAAQSQVIGLGARFAEEIRRLATGLDAIDREMRSDLESSVTSLNDLLDQIFKVNQDLRNSDEDAADHGQFIDERDRLIKELSSLVDVRTVEREGGAVALFTPAGLSLLDGAPSRFAYNGTTIVRVEDPTAPINGLLRNGRIKALLDLRLDTTGTNQPINSDPAMEIMRKLRSQLDGLVTAFTTGLGVSQTFAAAYDTAGSSIRISAPTQTTVQAGPTAFQASTVRFVGGIQQGDLFEVEINGKIFSYQAGPGDTSLDTIATRLTALINADTTIGVTAVAGIASMQIVGTTLDTKFTIKSRVNGELPELAQGFFTGTDRYSFQINRDLLEGNQQVKRNAAPEVINALASGDRSLIAAGLTLTGVSYKGMVIGLLGNSISGTKLVQEQNKYNTESLTIAEQRYQAEVGVNLDQEIADLQVLQNAYAASARLLTVIQTLFDTLQAAVAR
jgi:flagellar hook-associated protein 1